MNIWQHSIQLVYDLKSSWTRRSGMRSIFCSASDREKRHTERIGRRYFLWCKRRGLFKGHSPSAVVAIDIGRLDVYVGDCAAQAESMLRAVHPRGSFYLHEVSLRKTP